MIDETKKFIINNELLTGKNITLFAAVSGGIDSCVMLDVLDHLKNEINFRLEILHINHNTRGKDNLEDENLVEELANQYSVPMKLKRLENRTDRQSEVFLREQRYKFFNSIINNSEDAFIATAHNSDDNVETLLMRLFRGSHLKGLTGIQIKRGRFIRPLLSQSRKSIEQYAQKNNIRFREDYTNSDNEITRNYIRNELLPSINNKFKLDINTNILKSIKDLNQHYSLFTNVLKNAIRESVKISKQSAVLNKNKYILFNSIVQKGLVEYCISYVQPLNYGISIKNYLLWDDFIKNSKPGKKKNILDAGYAISERKEILFGGFPTEKKESYSLKLNSEILIDNKYKIAFSKVKSNKIDFNVDKNIEFIDGEKSGNDLVVRFWHKGDSFHPLGMKQKRKLSDFFIDLKLSTSLKKEIPIICKNQDILWIAGYRLDDQFKISDTTKNIYKIAMAEVNGNA
jgi:tRNA(Ile)-lysidine synthase